MTCDTSELGCPGHATSQLHGTDSKAHGSLPPSSRPQTGFAIQKPALLWHGQQSVNRVTHAWLPQVWCLRPRRSSQGSHVSIDAAGYGCKPHSQHELSNTRYAHHVCCGASARISRLHFPCRGVDRNPTAPAVRSSNHLRQAPKRSACKQPKNSSNSSSTPHHNNNLAI